MNIFSEDVVSKVKKPIFIIMILVFFIISLIGGVNIFYKVSMETSNTAILGKELQVLNAYNTAISNTMCINEKVQTGVELVKKVTNDANQVAPLKSNEEFSQIVASAKDYAGMNFSERQDLLNKIQNNLEYTQDQLDNSNDYTNGGILAICGVVGILLTVGAAIKYGLE